MGTKQLFFILLTIVIAGVAITTGVVLFKSHAETANRDAVIRDLNNLCDDAYTYYITSTDQGGGGHSFKKYKMPSGFSSTQNGNYTIQTAGNNNHIIFRGRGNEPGANPKKQAGVVAYKLEIKSSADRVLTKLN